MDSEQIGKVILELRKQNGFTQAQLAEKLCVSDKAVSKWELGASIPDIQQLESITQLFHISYDLLLSGDVEKVKLLNQKKNNEEPQKIIKKKVSSKEWYEIDNAGLIYPAQATEDWNLVFRVSAVMKEKVDEDVLNKALQDMVYRFPTFMTCLRKGFFWNYLERMERLPVVEKSDRHPNRPIKLDGKHYLFRVILDNNRISCEFFHTLTDGTGASIFVMSLLARYYELKYGNIKDYKDALNVLDSVNPEEIQDNFTYYATNNVIKGKKQSFTKAYKIKEKRISNNIVTHLVVNATELNLLAKKYDCTVTILLTAIYTKAFLKRRVFDKSFNPFIIQIPINLRKRFESKTLRNFSSYVNVEIDEQELSIEELVETIKKQVEVGAELDTLKQNINTIASYKNNIGVRIAPLGLKLLIMRIAASVIGDIGCTTVFSNLGKLNAPDELKRIVDRFEVVMKDDIMGGVSMSAVTFNNKCNISFTRSIAKSSIERDVARDLVNMGISVYAESNLGDKQ